MNTKAEDLKEKFIKECTHKLENQYTPTYPQFSIPPDDVFDWFINNLEAVLPISDEENKKALLKCLDLLRDIDLYGDISMPKKSVEECSMIATNGLHKLLAEHPFLKDFIPSQN